MNWCILFTLITRLVSAEVKLGADMSTDSAFCGNIGKWEDIHVAEYESLDDDMDDTMDLVEEAAKRKEKGKGRA